MPRARLAPSGATAKRGTYYACRTGTGDTVAAIPMFSAMLRAGAEQRPTAFCAVRGAPLLGVPVGNEA